MYVQKGQKKVGAKNIEGQDVKDDNDKGMGTANRGKNGGKMKAGHNPS